MKTFFKPTKAKVILAIFLLPFTYFLMSIFLAFYGLSSQRLCLPYIPSVSDNPVAEPTQAPTPTPQPFTFSNTMSDVDYEITTSGYEYCLGNGPSVRLAAFIISTYHTAFSIGAFLFPFFSSYLISCTIIYFVAKLKRQKKNYTAKKK